MHRSLLVRQVAPAVSLFLGLLAGSLLLDALLHRAGWTALGLWLGPIGTALIALSFLYSLRKRKIIQTGPPRTFLEWHQALGWSGALLVTVHGGVHFYALLPWAALAAMLIVVASGMTGGVLLRRALAVVRERGAETSDDWRLLLDAATVDAMKRWRSVHMPLNAVFLVLSLAHIVSAVLLKSW
ncbi:MAG TPA: hypothetical protein VFS09_09465 [Candidatus Eisenbacteria bacterium]|nr:hypothetical protein [Candidatus Eisenbacteria bacterium]